MFTFLQAIVTGSSGRLYAKTDKPYYVAGELVTGSIVCEALTPLSASGIDLKVSGYEKTEWHDLRHRTETIRPAHTDHNGHHHAAQTRSIPQLHRHRAKRTFFAQNMRIYNIQAGLLAPGTYTFPFQYQLPGDCPGSFYERTPLTNTPSGCEFIDNDSFGEGFFDSDDEYEGSVSRGASSYQRSSVLATIMYKLKVTLDINGMFSQDMYARIPLIVHPKLAVNLQPAMQTLTKQVTVCCCINKGNCTVCARFDKLAYVAGEVADVRCDITNESTSDLTTRVILRRYLNLKSNNSSKNITEDIVTQKFDVVKEKTNSMNRPMPLQLVGDKVKPTTNGQYITCNYEYLVECGVSMGDDINLKMPVTVYAPQPPPIGGGGAPAPPMVQLPPQQVQMMSSPPPQQQMNIQMSTMPPPQQQQQPMMNMQINMPGMSMQFGSQPGAPAANNRGKFDEAAYLNIHPDVKAANLGAFNHFKQYGKNENRVIQLSNGVRGTFDSNGYLNIHPDVRAAGQDGFTHFCNHGFSERRDIVVFPTAAVGQFDANGYLNLHPDVRNAKMDAWGHFVQYGKNENRKISVNHQGQQFAGTFDAVEYVKLHPDLVAAKVEGWTHYTQFGHKENRNVVVKL